MASVTKTTVVCDRCGCEIEPYFRKSITYKHYYTRMTFFSRDNQYCKAREVTQELCPECYAEIFDCAVKKKPSADE